MEVVQKKACDTQEERVNSEFSNIYEQRIKEYLKEDPRLTTIALALMEDLKPLTADKIPQIIEFLNDNHNANIEIADIYNTNKDIDRKHLAKTILAAEDIPKLYSKQFAKRIEGEETSTEVIFMKACSIYVDNLNNDISSNLSVNDDTGLGKDFIVHNVLDIFPKEKVIVRKSTSPKLLAYKNSLDYSPDWDWNGKILYLEDITSNVYNSPTFKVFSSASKDIWSTEILINQKPVEKKHRGRPSIIVTTAEVEGNSETLRRYPLLHIDDTKDQTRRIVDRSGVIAQCGKVKEIYDSPYTEALDNLERVNVKVPYGEKITKHLSAEHSIMRTNAHMIQDLIKISTALHQANREKDDEGYYLANEKDYDIGKRTYERLMGNEKSIPTTKKQEKIINEVKRLSKSSKFSVPELMKTIKGISKQSVYYNLEKLIELGLVTDLGDGEELQEGTLNARPSHYYKLNSFNSLVLPSYNEL